MSTLTCNIIQQLCILVDPDLVEKGNGYEFTSIFAGLKKENFRIGVHDGVMAVTASKSEDTDGNDGADAFYSLTRSILLPSGIDEKGITSKYDEDGTLSISIPKIPPGEKDMERDVDSIQVK